MPQLYEYTGPAKYRIARVARSTSPIIKSPVFSEDMLSDFDTAQQRIEHNLKSFPDRTKRDREVQDILQQQPKLKGWIARNTELRDEADRILPELADASKRINKLVNANIKGLVSNDHVEVAKALVAIADAYPSQLIKRVGILKRRKRGMKFLKLDGPVVRNVIAWSDSIVQWYTYMYKIGLQLGKSDAQVTSAARQSARMKGEWGS